MFQDCICPNIDGAVCATERICITLSLLKWVDIDTDACALGAIDTKEEAKVEDKRKQELIYNMRGVDERAKVGVDSFTGRISPVRL